MADAGMQAIVIDIIRRTFGAPDAEVSRETEAADIDGWDSLSHATLMIMIERKFHIDITEDESNDLQNVGDLFDLIERKVAH